MVWEGGLRMSDNTRTCKILIDDEWQSIRPINIKEGMTFRLFEEDGTPIACEDICSWVATSDAYYMEDGVICVKTDK